MTVSVGVLGKNSEWILKYSLRSLKKAVDYFGGDYEIVYVDGGSTDNSISVVKSYFPKARIIEAPDTTIPEARNIVVRESSGEYIVYWDSDILAPPNAIIELLNVGKPIVALQRVDVYVEKPEEAEKLFAYLGEKKPTRIREVDFAVFGVNLFHREVFEKVGLFDGDMSQAEDREFGLRASCKGYRTYVIDIPAYDINIRKISEVPIASPLKFYLRGIWKKARVYALTASPREKRNSAVYGLLHLATALGIYVNPLLALGEALPLAYHVYKYGIRKGAEMYLKSVSFYTALLLHMPLRFKKGCGMWS